MEFSLVVDVLEGLLNGVCVDTAPLQLPTKHRARQGLTAVPGFHPKPRESYVIDEADLLEAVKYALAGIRVCSAPLQVFAQFVASARSTG
jgi:hypothetical protein